MNKKLEIKNLKIVVKLGYHDYERELPQPVHLTIDVDYSDVNIFKLNPDSDYSKISRQLQDIVQDKSFELVEELADFLWSSLIDANIKVKKLQVTKLKPPCRSSQVNIDQGTCVISA